MPHPLCPFSHLPPCLQAVSQILSFRYFSSLAKVSFILQLSLILTITQQFFFFFFFHFAWNWTPSPECGACGAHPSKRYRCWGTIAVPEPGPGRSAFHSELRQLCLPSVWPWVLSVNPHSASVQTPAPQRSLFPVPLSLWKFDSGRGAGVCTRHSTPLTRVHTPLLAFPDAVEKSSVLW